MSQKMIIVTFAIVALGCVSPRTDGFDVSIREGESAKIMNVDNRAFSQAFSLENAYVRQEPSGYSIARIRIRNVWRDDISVQYKFRFFDKDDMELQLGARAWQQTIIHGGESVSLSATAPDKSVARFAVRVRRSM